MNSEPVDIQTFTGVPLQAMLPEVLGDQYCNPVPAATTCWDPPIARTGFVVVVAMFLEAQVFPLSLDSYRTFPEVQ